MNVKNGIVVLLVGLFIFVSSFAYAEVEEKIPDFEITTIDGKVIKTSEIIGSHPLLLVFWASWCPACKKEIPRLNKLVEEFGPKGMKFIGVNVGVNDSAKKAGRFAKKYSMNFPIYFDEGSVLTKKFKVPGTPGIVIADKSGVIRYRNFVVPEDMAAMFDEYNK